jgi:heat-inducible transcriptional repressor
MDITERQRFILKAIINEYIQNGKPVGSSVLGKKYDIPASPATIRYEMARLAHEGLITKPHRSAGRVPTITGLKFYLSNIFEEGVVDYRIETEIKSRLNKARFDKEKLLRECVSILAEKTETLGWSIMPDGVRVSGISYILDFPKDLLKVIFALMEDDKMIREILSNFKGKGLIVILGDEFGLKGLSNCAWLLHRVELYGLRGILGILGPLSLNYHKAIPILKFVASTVTNLVKDWKPRK